MTKTENLNPHAIRRCASGFTLIEVLISVFILVISLTGSLLVFVKCNILITEVRQRVIASQAVTEEMEKIRDMPYSSILELGETFTTTSMNNLVNAAGTLTIDDPFSSSDIRRVTATLTWEYPLGRELSTSFSTYVSNSGIDRQ